MEIEESYILEYVIQYSIYRYRINILLIYNINIYIYIYINRIVN